MEKIFINFVRSFILIHLDFCVLFCYNAYCIINTTKREDFTMFSRKFIKATADFCTYENNVHAPYIRKSFNLEKAPEKAVVTLTSTGFYRFFVNGKDITASRLAPAITNPDDILFYDTYDVAEYLNDGENVFGFMLGNGISNCMGGYIWDFDKAVFRSSPKLALHFECDELSCVFSNNFL